MALPIDGILLSSAEIDKSLLRPPEHILRNQQKISITNVGKLAVQLARESIFGIDIMKKCTPLGAGKLKGLPVLEMTKLKQLILDRFPEYWGDPTMFEAVWKKCQSSTHSCSALRRMKYSRW